MKIQYEKSGSAAITFDNGRHLSGIQPVHSEWKKYDLDNTVIEPYVDPEISYADKRIKEYGDVTDQLDEIYHDIDKWRTRIGKIKTKHPK